MKRSGMAAMAGMILTELLPCAQPPAAAPKRTVSGEVRNAVTGEPVNRAVVALASSIGSRNAVTGADGRFSISGLPGASAYRLSASRSGYVRSFSSVGFEAGSASAEVTIRLVPAGAISGRVLDDESEPLSPVQVLALRNDYSRGFPLLSVAASATTNDLGEYRIHGLAPGRYFVCAHYTDSDASLSSGIDRNRSVAAGLRKGYAPLYYPGAVEPSGASPVRIEPGADMRGIDFRLAPTNTFRVRGRTLDAETAEPVKMFLVFLTPRDASMLVDRSVSHAMGADGAFEFAGVVPGSYFLSADAPGSNRPYRAQQPVEVGAEDVEGVQLMVGRGMDLQGVVHTDGAAQADVRSVRIYLKCRDTPLAGFASETQPDGKFTLRGITPGAYLLSAMEMPPALYIKSARFGGSDVLAKALQVTAAGEEALEVTLAPGASLEGAVLDRDGKAAPGARVVLVPGAAHRMQHRLYKTATAGPDGRFAMRGIAPGEYRAFAWEYAEPWAFMDPEFLSEREDRGERVSFEEGSHRSLPLRLIPPAGN